MEVIKVATTTSFHWSGRNTAVPQCPCFSQTPSSSKRRLSRGRTRDAAVGGLLAYQTRLKPSTFLGTRSRKLHRSQSCELREFSNSTTTKIRTGVQKHNSLRKVCSASSGFFSDEAFSVKSEIINEAVDNDYRSHRFGTMKLLKESVPGLASLEAPWVEMVNHSSIEQKANSFGLPVSLRIIKRKLQEEALKEASETTYCSINRAFSSMVFMIEELHSFALQTRVSVLRQVKKDMHASLLWVFQRVFSQTPTLMVYVMILLANYIVHSVASNLAITVSPLHSAVKKDAPEFTESSEGGQIDLGHVVSRTAGSKWLGSITFDKISHLPTYLNCVSEEGMREEEVSLWNLMVEEADQMQDSPIDHDVRLILVSPIIAKVELDDYDNYTRTELSYKIGLAQEPNNPLLLANYAQFLYLVTQDYDRAEKCFKKALKSEEVDAETYSKYAIFLWKVRNDLWAAEDNFLEAISADPTNSFYAAYYADFLWQTGGEETCFPFESSDWWIY